MMGLRTGLLIRAPGDAGRTESDLGRSERVFDAGGGVFEDQTQGCGCVFALEMDSSGDAGSVTRR